jgi:hypothetical protein
MTPSRNLRAALALTRVSAALLPATNRDRYREQWQADMHGAAELGLSPLRLAAGAAIAAIRLAGSSRRGTPMGVRDGCLFRLPAGNRRSLGLALLGGLSLTGGTLSLLLSGGYIDHFLVSGLVVCASGSLLLWLGLTARPVGRTGWLATGTLAVIGLSLSLLVVRESVCCMFAYHRGLGYPWIWFSNHGQADTLEAIEAMKANPARLDGSVAPFYMVLDQLFWWYTAVLLVVPLTLGWRARRRTIAPEAAG